ncbi:MAG: ABC transporter permease [Saprospiraceae bacterium]|nr:ABC transporter permease [Saprospiraceae bacterium]
MLYTSKRLIGGLVAIFFASTLIATLIFLVPVDPARMTFGQRLESKTLENTRARYGLDQPLPVQLSLYLRDLSPVNILRNDHAMIDEYQKLASLSLGTKTLIIKWPYLRQSYQTGRSVWSILSEALPQTIILAFAALLLATPIGIILGFVSARHVHTVVDNILISISVLGYSVPSYVSALVFAIVFGYLLGQWTGLPVQGSLIESDHLGQTSWNWTHLILPALALGIRPVAVIMQITRSAVLGEIKLNYVTMARAKGMGEWSVLRKHVFRNAGNPIITAVSGWFAALIAGSFFVESIFNYNGIGKVTVNALLMFDVPVLIGAIVTISGLYVLVNIITDLIYRALDVRTELE